MNRVLKLRNPWGGTEWKGTWSDKSDIWTDASKKKLGWTAEDDGLFFMAFEDYAEAFSDTTFCMQDDPTVYLHNEVTIDFNGNNEGTTLKFNLPKAVDTNQQGFAIGIS